MGLFDFWKKNKQDNSLDGGGLSTLVFFSGTPSWENIITAKDYGADVSYSVAYALANKNVVVSRFIQFLADAITGISIVDKEGDEINGSIGLTILDEVKTVFGSEGDMTEWIYNTIRNYVACGMTINAPSIVSDKGYAVKVVPLDNRKVRLEEDKQGGYSLTYNGEKIEFYSKTLKKPSLNRSGYGDCLFSGAIDDALVDKYTKLTAQKKYENNANPDLIYMMENNTLITKEDLEKMERKIKEKYSGIENKGKPLVSNMIKDVKVIDTMDSVIKSIDIRLHSNKNIGLMLGIDLRGLGWLREGGSEAELRAVADAVNAEFSKRASLLSKTLTRSYEKLVAPLNGKKIKFLPTYIKDNQALIKIAMEACDKDIVEKEFVENLIYNELM